MFLRFLQLKFWVPKTWNKKELVLFILVQARYKLTYVYYIKEFCLDPHKGELLPHKHDRADEEQQHHLPIQLELGYVTYC